MKSSIIVIDDFYKNPDPVRELGLRQDFNVSGNYPGLRSKPFKSGGVKEALEFWLRRPIEEKSWNSIDYNGAFQYATKDAVTWIHCDKFNEFAAVVFLSPNPSPHTGVAFYQHKETGDYRWNDETGSMLDNKGSAWDEWEVADRVENRYNRCVIFDSQLFHAAEGYFGDNLENARLFQTYFFDQHKNK